MSTKNKTSASDRVRALTDGLNTEDETETLEVLTRLIDALQYAQGYSYSNPMIKIANFVASVADVPWDDLRFSLAKAVATNGRAYEVARQYGADPKDIPKLLLEAVTLFADLLAENVAADPDTAAADIFDAVVAELAENSKAAPEPRLPPEIYNPRMVARVFEPAPFSLELSGKLQMTLVTYTGGQGDDLLALAFEAPGDDKSYFLILETGECVEAKKEACSLALINEESYANIPAELLAFVSLATPELEIHDVIRSATARAIEAGALGKFKTDVCTINVKAEDLKPLLHVIDTAHEVGSMGGAGATGPTGALLKFPVPNVPGLSVVLEAQVSATGPYVVARLVEATAAGDKVLMRLDQPRHDAVKGLYFFPHAKQAVVLKA